MLAITSVLFLSCKKNTAESKPTTAATTENAAPKVKKEIAVANLQTSNFTIKGMTCAMGCAKTIEGELAALDGVQSAKVDFDKKTAEVIFDKTIQTPEALTKVVQATGDGKTYTVSNMK